MTNDFLEKNLLDYLNLISIGYGTLDDDIYDQLDYLWSQLPENSRGFSRQVAADLNWTKGDKRKEINKDHISHAKALLASSKRKANNLEDLHHLRMVQGVIPKEMISYKRGEIFYALNVFHLAHEFFEDAYNESRNDQFFILSILSLLNFDINLAFDRALGVINSWENESYSIGVLLGAILVFFERNDFQFQDARKVVRIANFIVQETKKSNDYMDRVMLVAASVVGGTLCLFLGNSKKAKELFRVGLRKGAGQDQALLSFLVEQESKRDKRIRTINLYRRTHNIVRRNFASLSTFKDQISHQMTA